jgi:Rrf2 family transcriptional regulator, iron-sulfur cluster assembly transcription factor
MLSQTSEHALRAVLYLAQQARGERVSADAMARALDAPANYLSKILNALAKQGVLGSVRGPGGGFWLQVDPRTLSVASLVRIFDEPKKKTMCLLGGRPCTDERPCSVHFRWKELAAESARPLERTFLADLLASRRLPYLPDSV